MKAFDSRTSTAPAQRMEGSRSHMPPAFNPTASETQDHSAPDSLQHLEEDGVDLQEKTSEEQITVSKLSEALHGQAEDVLTEDALTMNLSNIPKGIIRTFKFGGVQFLVYDVGGDENAQTRRALGATITLLKQMDTHDYKKQPARKFVRLFIGDYKAMRAFADANPQLPYKNWKEQFTARRYSGQQFTYTEDNGQVIPFTASTIAQGFVSSFHDRSRPLEMQNRHYAAFLDMSQIDRFGINTKDPLVKQAMDLAWIIAHEATHTLTKDGDHAGGLMTAGGVRSSLESDATVKDPKTGKETIDLDKYFDLVKELMKEFGKPF